MTGQKHDNDYYLGRLKKVNPALYNDVLAGKLTVNKARQMAGLGGGRNTVNELLRNWGKATAAERATFLARTGLSLSSPLPPPPVWM